MWHWQIEYCCFHYNENFKKNLFPDSVKLVQYFASAVIQISPNPCVRSTPKTEVSCSLSSVCTDKLLSTSKTITFFLILKSFVHKFLFFKVLISVSETKDFQSLLLNILLYHYLATMISLIHVLYLPIFCLICGLIHLKFLEKH